MGALNGHIVSFFNLNNQTHGLNNRLKLVVELRDWKETLCILLAAIQEVFDTIHKLHLKRHSMLTGKQNESSLPTGNQNLACKGQIPVRKQARKPSAMKWLLIIFGSLKDLYQCHQNE